MVTAIASTIGARTLTVPSGRDRFTADSAGPPDGTGINLGINSGANTWYAHDRSGGLQPFRFVAGASKTVNFWLHSFPYWQLGTQTLMSCHEAGIIPGNHATNNNWRLYPAASNTRSASLSIGTQVIGSTGNFFGVNQWKMVTIVFNHSIGTHGNAKVFVDGVQLVNGNLSAAAPALSTPEFSLGADNAALSSPLGIVGTAQGGNIRLAKLQAFSGAWTVDEILSVYFAMKGKF